MTIATLRHTLATALLAAATALPSAAQSQDSHRRLYPFVTAGYTLSSFAVDMDGHHGFNAGVGAVVPLFDHGLVGVRPQLLYVQKGDRNRFMVYNRERTIRFNANYVELPVDLVLGGRRLGTPFNVSALVGLYAAYGVSGVTKASDGIYVYNRYRVADRPSTFGSEMDARRFDWGLRLGVLGRLGRYAFSAAAEAGAERVMSSRVTRHHYGDDPHNVALMLNLAYEF